MRRACGAVFWGPVILFDSIFAGIFVRHHLIFLASFAALTTTWGGQVGDARAQEAPDIEAREADIFGAPDEDDAVPDAEDPAESGAGDARLSAEDQRDTGFSDDTSLPAPDISLQQRMAQRLAEHEEKSLDLGGSLFSLLQYSLLERGDAGDFPLTQSNLLNVYLDARPNQRLRVYTRGRLYYTPTASGAGPFPAAGAAGASGGGGLSALGGAQEAVRTELDQLWVKFDIAQTLYVTAGRQHLRWGVGRFWFPNDFLFEQRLDPLAILDTRRGADLLKVHLPLESLGWNFYAVANLEGADTARKVGGAGRAEVLWGQTEIGLSAAVQHERPTQLGADISTGIGWFELRAGFSLTHNLQTPFVRGSTNLEEFEAITLANILTLEVPETYSRADDWIPRALLGAEVDIPYALDDTLYVGAEYFFNDAGSTDPALYPWLILNGAFRPLYTGRHYAAIYLLAPAPGAWNDSTFSLATLANLSDRSVLSRLDYSVHVLTHLRVFAFGSLAWGNRGELNLGLRIPSISADVLALAQASGQFGAPAGMDLSAGFAGIDIPATRAMLGAGLSLNF